MKPRDDCRTERALVSFATVDMNARMACRYSAPPCTVATSTKVWFGKEMLATA